MDTAPRGWDREEGSQDGPDEVPGHAGADATYLGCRPVWGGWKLGLLSFLHPRVQLEEKWRPRET